MCREAGGENVGDFDCEGGSGRRGRNGVYGEEGVGGYCHGEDGVEGVVDVLADDVDSAGRTGDEFSGLAIVGFELPEEGIPAHALSKNCVFGVDVGQGPGAC